MLPKMALKEEGLYTIVKVMSIVTSPTKMGSMTSPRETVWAPLKPIRTALGFGGCWVGVLV